MVRLRVLICGSRVEFEASKAYSLINRIIDDHPSAVFLHGGATGVDELADNILKTKGVAVEVYKSNYSRYGRKAPLVRDREMVDRADIVYALWNGRSRGTKYVIDYAKSTGKVVKVMEV